MRALEGNYNLTHQVTNKLGLDIVQGKYNNGQPFPTEAQLAEQFDISRSVMREAVKMLTAKGLISSRPRQGIRLSPASQWNMFDSDVLAWTLKARPSMSLLKEFTELRYAIEPEAVALAARIGDQEAIARIGAALERMRAAESGDDDNLEADIEFHNQILYASQNRFFIQLSHFIETALRVAITFTNKMADTRFASWEDHKKVYDPIANGDTAAASAAMRRLLEEALDLINSALEVEKQRNR